MGEGRTETGDRRQEAIEVNNFKPLNLSTYSRITVALRTFASLQQSINSITFQPFNLSTYKLINK
jgi:hypothetical protein